MTPPDWNSRKLHFIGIGGAGMSGLALVAVRLGAEVTGSDRNESSYLERVRRSGATVFLGHEQKSSQDLYANGGTECRRRDGTTPGLR